MTSDELRLRILDSRPTTGASPELAIELAHAAAGLAGADDPIFGVPPDRVRALPGAAGLVSTVVDALRAWIPRLDGAPLEAVAAVIRRAKLPIDLDDDDDPPAPPPAVEPSNAELVRAALESPDAETYGVLGDWLQAQGSPRGELIALSLRAQTDPSLVASPASIDRFIANHGDVLLGPLTRYAIRRDTYDTPAFTWQWGYIDDATLAFDEYQQNERFPLVDGVELLLAHPSGQLLTSLHIGVDGDAGNGLQGVIDAIVARRPAQLRCLELGAFEIKKQFELSWFVTGDVSALWAALPDLHRLRIQGTDAVLGSVAHAQLARLEVCTVGLSAETARAIANAALPQLRTLEVWFGTPEHGGTAALDDIAPLLQRRDLPKLKKLGLKNATFTDALCEAIVGSPLLSQLERLDLSLGILTDAGADTLARHAERLAHLEILDVSRGYLSPAGVERVRGLARKVRAADQRVADDGERYVAVGE